MAHNRFNSPRKVKGEWVYPHSADVLVVAHLQPIKFYTQNCCHTLYNTIRDRGVLKECKGAERRRGTPPRLFWAGQDIIHVHVAPQARPTIAAEERPREAMSAVTEEVERAWARAHIND